MARAATQTRKASRRSSKSSNGASKRSSAASKSSASASGNGASSSATRPRASYDRFKEFKGKRYTGMAVGRGHKWQYAEGVWTEKKVTPDQWEFHYEVRKRRTGKAPEGSGAPVGSGYHWYILAHQTATKCDANNYVTEMKGVKYKLAHKRAEKASWSASERAQRKRLIAILKDTIAALEAEEATDAPAPSAAPSAAPRRAA